MTKSRQSADYAAGGFYAGKNKIINGDFSIWQRGTSFSSPANASYVADRWAIECGSTTGLTVSQQTFTAGAAPVSGYEGNFFLRYAVSSANATHGIRQPIEDVRTFANQTVTLSVWLKAAASTTVTAIITQNFGSGGSANVDAGSTTFSVTTSWQRFTWTVTIPSVSGKTIGTSSYLNIRLLNLINATFTLDYWGVQVEAGSTATAFQTASGSIGGELALCQRYYTRTTSDTAYGAVGMGFTTATTAANGLFSYPVTLRTQPSSVDYSTLQIAGSGFAGTVSTITLSGYSNKQFVILDITGTGFAASQPIQIRGNNSSTAYLGFSAEL